MRVLIVGYGSIGGRHARVLTSLGAAVSVVTANAACPFPRYASIEAALRTQLFERVIICNATANHLVAASALLAASYRGPVMIEKPLFAVDSIPDEVTGLDICVAYNLRFHAVIQSLRKAIAGRQLFTASFEAGQYLPDWRPDTDYRTSYSARRSEGGGVLKDLSHELDLANWLCGAWDRVAAVGGKVSPLQIDSDDIYSMLLVHARCPAVNVTVNYLSRVARRVICINAHGLTAIADLVAGTLTLNGVVDRFETARDDTYLAQARALLEDDRRTLCSFGEGRQVDGLIAAAERAASAGEWVASTPAIDRRD